MANKKFYVYVLKVAPGTVFYVGKGSNQRAYWHRRVLSRPHLKEFQRGVYQRMRTFLAGRAFVEEIVYETDDEIAALLHERQLITHYGFETLVNTQTHAFTGRKLKPEVGKLIAVRLRAYVDRCRAKYGTGHPPEVAVKISAANKGHSVTPETIIAIQAGRASNSKLQTFLVEHCRALAESQRGKKQTAAHIEAAHAPLRGRKVSAEGRAKMSVAMAGKGPRTGAKSTYRGVQWLNGDWRALISTGGTRKFLGSFKLEIDAAFTYDNAFEDAHGTRPNGTLRDHTVTRYRWGMRGKLVPR